MGVRWRPAFSHTSHLANQHFIFLFTALMQSNILGISTMTEWFTDLSPLSKALLQGQWISILIAGTGIFATILSDTHPSSNFPLLMSSCNYVLLSSYLCRKFLFPGGKTGRVLAQQHEQNEIVDTNTMESSQHSTHSLNDIQIEPQMLQGTNIIWWYVLAAILDVEANYLVILSYNYTTITSVMLLDCFTIPCAMVLSFLFLGCRYNYKHILGTVICLMGLACIVINDSVKTTDDDAPNGSNPVLGDILCLSGAVLYACSNVLQEHLVKFHDREEFLGFLGCFGFVIAFVQCMFVDLPSMRKANFSPKVIGGISGFVVCLFLMYTNTTSFLQHGDAVLFNLSLLTSDVYAVVFTYFFSGYLVNWLYFVAFALVIVGLIIYHSQPAPLHIGRDLGDVGLFRLMPSNLCATSVCGVCTCCAEDEERITLDSNGYHTTKGARMDSCTSSSSVDNDVMPRDSVCSTNISSSLYAQRIGSSSTIAQYNPLAGHDDSVGSTFSC